MCAINTQPLIPTLAISAVFALVLFTVVRSFAVWLKILHQKHGDFLAVFGLCVRSRAKHYYEICSQICSHAFQVDAISLSLTHSFSLFLQRTSSENRTTFYMLFLLAVSSSRGMQHDRIMLSSFLECLCHHLYFSVYTESVSTSFRYDFFSI